MPLPPRLQTPRLPIDLPGSRQNPRVVRSCRLQGGSSLMDRGIPQTPTPAAGDLPPEADADAEPWPGTPTPPRPILKPPKALVRTQPPSCPHLTPVTHPIPHH